MGFYLKLAISNLRKNAQMVIPFMMTTILTVAMFYNSINLTFDSTTGTGNLSTLISMMSVLMMIFSFGFLIYTNSFLTKRRKNEFGLYNILGLRKSQISTIILIENGIIGTVSIALGLLIGILFSRLMIFTLYKIIKFDLKYSFKISADAVLMCLGLFAVIFIVIGILSIISVYRTKAIDMLSASKKADKMPKSNIFSFILGLILLGGGYFLALSVEDIMVAVILFLFATILVAAGTYFVFSSFSSYILQALKKNKRVFLKPENFIAISGLIHRIKKNALGLTVICVLSTGIILMLSTTLSLYLGFDQILDNRYPTDVQMNVKMLENIDYDAIEKIEQNIKNTYSENKNYISYTHFDFWIDEVTGEASFFEHIDGEGSQFAGLDTLANIRKVEVMTLSGYNSLMGKNETLNAGEVITANVENDTLVLNGTSFDIAKKDESILKNVSDLYTFFESYIIVMNDSDFNTFFENSTQYTVTTTIAFDLPYNSDVTSGELQNFIDNNNGNVDSIYLEFKADHVNEFYSIYGTLFFIGLFLGTLFIVSVLLIIYYKQLIEGYEDRKNFVIMKKIGLDDALAKKTINKQVKMVFMLPIIMAVIHMAFAFKGLMLIMAIFNLTDAVFFICITLLVILVFIAVYLVMYKITSKVYYNIVSE